MLQENTFQKTRCLRKLKKNDFRKYKFQKCVYEYGNTWYEIRIEGIHDNKTNQIIMPDGKSLYDHVAEKFGKYKSEHFLALPKDSDVLIYHTSSGAEKACTGRPM